MNKHNVDLFERPGTQFKGYAPDLTNQVQRRIVDVFDRHGGHLASYTVCLSGSDSTEAEFEEVALILAEQSGQVQKVEFMHLRARCAQ